MRFLKKYSLVTYGCFIWFFYRFFVYMFHLFNLQYDSGIGAIAFVGIYCLSILYPILAFPFWLVSKVCFFLNNSHSLQSQSVLTFLGGLLIFFLLDLFRIYIKKKRNGINREY